MYVHLFLFTSSIQTCWYWSGSLFCLVDTLVGGDSCPYFRGSMTLVQAQWNFLQRIDTRYLVLVPYQWIMQLYTVRKTELKVQVPQALLLWRKEPIFWLRPQSLVFPRKEPIFWLRPQSLAFPSWTVSVGHSPISSSWFAIRGTASCLHTLGAHRVDNWLLHTCTRIIG